MAKKPSKISSSYVQVEWNGEELSDALLAFLKQELDPIAAKMESAAKVLCPVSAKEKAAPATRRRLAYGYDADGNRSRARVDNVSRTLKLKSKRGYRNLRDYRNVVMRRIHRPHENRVPGRLRDSIRSTAAARKDKTAFLVFLEAGNDMAFYAPFVELGTHKMVARPFLRPAFNTYKAAAITAIQRALARLGQA